MQTPTLFVMMYYLWEIAAKKSYSFMMGKDCLSNWFSCLCMDICTKVFLPTREFGYFHHYGQFFYLFIETLLTVLTAVCSKIKGCSLMWQNRSTCLFYWGVAFI